MRRRHTDIAQKVGKQRRTVMCSGFNSFFCCVTEIRFFRVTRKVHESIMSFWLRALCDQLHQSACEPRSQCRRATAQFLQAFVNATYPTVTFHGWLAAPRHVIKYKTDCMPSRIPFQVVTPGVPHAHSCLSPKFVPQKKVIIAVASGQRHYFWLKWNILWVAGVLGACTVHTVCTMFNSYQTQTGLHPRGGARE